MTTAVREQRRDARLLVLEAATGRVIDRAIGDLPDLLQPGDLLVLNDAATLPASDFGEAPGTLRLRLATSLLYVPADAPGAARESILSDLLEQADALPTGDETRLLDLPALDEAAARLAEFTSSLGSV